MKGRKFESNEVLQKWQPGIICQFTASFISGCSFSFYL
ncbi:hypothetical protein L579_1006 [Pantoea sp. AS-PWVM4]|nr:hypothetical protein L579_1006 [Pantoea sp. AS-PWVM4]